MSTSLDPDIDAIVAESIATFNRLGFHVPQNRYTILASFTLLSVATGHRKLISLGAGSKCVPRDKLSTLR